MMTLLAATLGPRTDIVQMTQHQENLPPKLESEVDHCRLCRDLAEVCHHFIRQSGVLVLFTLHYLYFSITRLHPACDL